VKLCFLATSDSIHSLRWIRFFCEKGHDIHWISLTPFGSHTLAGATLYDLSSKHGRYVSLGLAALKVRKIIQCIDPDIVHAHYAGSYGVLAAIAGFHPFVLTAWGSDILFAGQDPVKGTLVKWVLRKACLITCDAYHMADAMRALGADTTKMELVFFGVEVDRFCPGPSDQQTRARWGAQQHCVVISLRNLEPVYSVETLINAVPPVIAEVPEARFIIAGAGSQGSVLKALCRDLNVEKHVVFVGRYSNTDLPNMLRSSDMYISTSLSDAGIAASTAEAMACGLPVVVTDTGENSRWIEEGKTGFVVAAKDPDALASKIVFLLKNDRDRLVIGKAAREKIVKSNSYVLEMDKMERLYERLIHSRSG
jgi:L-malate glycosyltransferase